MSAFEIEENQLNALPDGDVSDDIFILDDTGIVDPKDVTASGDNALPTELSKSPISNSSSGKVDRNFVGGPSVTRSNEDYADCIPTSATVTVGETREDDPNQHERLAQVLTQSSSTIWRQGTSDTYVVQPRTDFANDSDPQYLETRFPDLLPYGRGGFGEKREILISRAALVAYMMNLATNQFQHPSFILPVYNMLVREAVASKSFVRSRLPASVYRGDGSRMSKGEAFCGIPVNDLHQATDYQKKCG